jgi:DhnA family fructose-bisphosphate aldolase class Ia
MGFKGLFQKNDHEILHTSGILNLTASTTKSKHTRKVLISHVEDAVRLGMDAVAVHVNIGSEYETEMLKILGDISNECDLLAMPLMALMYPRTEHNGVDYNYEDLKKDQPEKYAEIVRHTARVGVELGADIIKTQFTGDPETFHTVIESCYDVPIVTAGGPLVLADKMLENACYAIQAGASGVCFGRNVFNRRNSTPYVRALRKIVHDGCTLDDAKQFLLSNSSDTLESIMVPEK